MVSRIFSVCKKRDGHLCVTSIESGFPTLGGKMGRCEDRGSAHNFSYSEGASHVKLTLGPGVIANSGGSGRVVAGG